MYCGVARKQEGHVQVCTGELCVLVVHLSFVKSLSQRLQAFCRIQYGVWLIGLGWFTNKTSLHFCPQFPSCTRVTFRVSVPSSGMGGRSMRKQFLFYSDLSPGLIWTLLLPKVNIIELTVSCLESRTGWVKTLL